MKQLKKYTIIGTFFVLITGTLSHFIYEWSGNNFIVGFFFPVNESTWEHMKLVFFPMFLFSIFMFKRLNGNHSHILQSLSLGILIGTFLIPVLFYTYTGIIGRHFMVMDIIIFVIGVLVGFYINCHIVNNHNDSGKSYKLFGCLIFSITALLFFVFTFIPPQINLFLDPISKTFGIS